MRKTFIIIGVIALIFTGKISYAESVGSEIQDAKVFISGMPTFNHDSITAIFNLLKEIDYCSETSVQTKLVEKDGSYELYIYSELTPASGDYGDYLITLKGNKTNDTLTMTCVDHEVSESLMDSSSTSETSGGTNTIGIPSYSTTKSSMASSTLVNSPSIVCTIDGDAGSEETVSLSMNMLKSDDSDAATCWWYKTFTIESSVKDTDGDYIIDSKDNCPQDANENQKDTDKNGIGDKCDTTSDADKDGIADSVDNCPKTANPDQKDLNSDGVGDACFSGSTSSGLKGKDCSLHMGAVNSTSGFLLDVLLLCGPLAVTCLRRRSK